MKKILVPLLALVLLIASIGATADGSDAVTLEVNTGKNKVYMSDDPYIASLRGDAAEPEGDALPVLVLPVKKGIQLQVTVKPAAVKNKKVILSVDDAAVAQVQGTGLTGLKAGETVLTIASEADPAATVQYRVLVIRQVSRISLTASEKSVAVGGSISLTPEFTPEDATLKQVSWSSDNEKIATVDQDGIVTGMKRGTVRMIATAQDGSNVRANISVQVVQLAEEITLKETEVTVDTGRNVMLHATVLPTDTNDKSVVWTSSDESIATVNTQGRVTGVSLGDCEIICASSTAGSVEARAVVHVQQPVKGIAFGEAPTVYVNETGKLTWNVEPSDANNPEVILTSGNEKILTVNQDGTVTGVKAGETFVQAVIADGSNRQARIKIKVYQHVESVQMKRNTAYIDTGSSSIAGAILSPKNAANQNMTWESEDPAIASVKPVAKQTYRVNISGLQEGTTTVTGTTVDGGLQTSIKVIVGSFEKSLKLDKDHTYVQGSGDVVIRVKNISDLTITSVTATVAVTDVDGNPVPCNSKDDSNTFTVEYKSTLGPGETSRDSKWKYVDFKYPESTAVSQYEVRITQFQIDHDWIKTIRKKYQPVLKCPVHL